MPSTSRAWFLILAFAVLAIGAGVLADVYKWSWARDWLSPLMMLLFLIALSTASSTRDSPATIRGVRVPLWAKVAAVVVPVYAFLNIEIAGDTPVAMRLFGMSWTMGPKGASMLLALGGIAMGATAVGLSWKEARAKAAAGATTRGAGPQAPPPPASPSTK